MKTYAPILFILAASTAFSRVLTLYAGTAGGQRMDTRTFQQRDNPSGCYKHFPSRCRNGNGYNTGDTFILSPILMPIVQSIGMDPVHFGVIMIVNLAIGFITPPIGGKSFLWQVH